MLQREAPGLAPSPVPEAPRDPLPASPSVEPPAPELTGCVDFTRSYTSMPPTVLLLIDQSGSMQFRFGESTRWNVLRDAIVEPGTGLLDYLGPSANVGLMMYTSLNGFQEGFECPLLIELPAAFGNVEQIRATYLAAQPVGNGDTPTGESIDQAVERLASVEPGAPKYILLVTDGDPDTCAMPDPELGLFDTIAAAERAHEQGIVVRVVGVSQGIGRRGLQAVANAGAGKRWDLVYGEDEGAEEPLYASTDARELSEQLKGIIGDVRTCTVELGETVSARWALSGRLVLDGVPLQFGALDGWTFVDDDTIQIHGDSCARILDDGQRLSVRFPCEDGETSIR